MPDQPKTHFDGCDACAGHPAFLFQRLLPSGLFDILVLCQQCSKEFEPVADKRGYERIALDVTYE
ncbi:MAG: hypothetical protein KGZ39_00420 [Simkania sp.]|nr:hypothetical protein [Simkania sp.]